MEAGAKEVAVFGAASESFSRKNINCSIEESIKRFKEVVIEAKKNGIRIRGYVSCVCGCPYEGPIAPSAVAKASRSFYTLKCIILEILGNCLKIYIITGCCCAVRSRLLRSIPR